MENISIDTVSKRFEEHLAIPGNNRIIFSGKFGIGKTWFLNEFFKERESEYNKFLISPVNYAVSSNEDIFELIKADIIKDLFLSGKITLKQLPEDNSLQKIADIVGNKQFVFGKFLLNTLSKLNPSFETPKQIIDLIGDIYTSSNRKKSKKQSEKTLTEEIADYWFETNEKIGGIYEHNYIARCINFFLEEIKNKGCKKNVLIIDDLDRIDPEHIFRILNILSAHNNQLGETNKFNFDHIIIVCDIDNIKNTYFHRYGVSVDFEGYIDKFFANEIYYFTNQDAIKHYVNSSFASKHTDVRCLDFIIILLEILIDSGLLTVRKMLKYKSKILYEGFSLYEQFGIKASMEYIINRDNFFSLSPRLFTNSNDFPILTFFKSMSVVFGDFNSFYEKLNELKESKKKIEFKYCKSAIEFLALQLHIAVVEGDGLFFRLHGDLSRGLTIVPPYFDLFSRHCEIKLKWSNANKYSGDNTYFEGAAAQFSLENMEPIEVAEFSKSILRIIENCEKRGFLKSANIHFSKSIK